MIALFARYYYWETWPLPSQPASQEAGPYTLLTDAFLHAQASLRVAPAPQLLALPDPYDPAQNASYRLHDASLFQGKYYLYFGPSPVVLLYLPYRLLSGKFLPDRIGTWIFATAAYAAACFLLKLLLTRWWPRAPKWLSFFLCGCLGFSNTFPFLLRRPAVYETAIAASQFFVLLALYAVARIRFGCRRPVLTALFAGLALAAVFGSRPPQVLAAAALLVLVLPGNSVDPRERLRRLGMALVSLAAGIAPILYYNYVRFHSPVEFGTHYMLSGFNVRKASFFSATRILPDLWFSVIEPPRLISQFPFVALAPNPPFRLPHGFELEVVAGIVWIAPTVLLLAAAPLVWKKMDPGRRIEWSIGTAVLACLGAGWIVVDSLVGASMRYQADFAAILFLAAALVIAGLHEIVRVRRRKWLIGVIFALGLFGVIVNGTTALRGYYYRSTNVPGPYQAIVGWFNPVAKTLAWFGVPSEPSPAPQVR